MPELSPSIQVGSTCIPTRTHEFVLNNQLPIFPICFPKNQLPGLHLPAFTQTLFLPVCTLLSLFFSLALPSTTASIGGYRGPQISRNVAGSPRAALPRRVIPCRHRRTIPPTGVSACAWEHVYRVSTYAGVHICGCVHVRHSLTQLSLPCRQWFSRRARQRCKKSCGFARATRYQLSRRAPAHP